MVSEGGERTFFVCKHVSEEHRGVLGFCVNPKPGTDERSELLCADCSWGDGDKQVYDPEQLQAFPEAEAVARGWIPATRAMQYLLYVTNDCTGGEAVSSRHSLLARRGGRSGLTDLEQHVLYELFNRDQDHPGMAELTHKESVVADMLTGKMFK